MSANLKTSNFSLRVMEELDIPVVMSIEESNYQFPWTKQIMKDCLRVGYACRILEVDEQIIGYVIMSTGAGEAHILNLCIEETAQGQGWGREMMKHMLVIARTAKVETVFLEVRPSNIAAIRLYQSLGFNEIGARSNYYPAKQGREDALVFALSLFT